MSVEVSLLCFSNSCHVFFVLRYKRRTAAVLARGSSDSESPSHVSSQQTPAAPTCDWENELTVYKARTSEALRHANESVAKYRAAALRNTEEDTATKERCAFLEARAASAESEAVKARGESEAATREAVAASQSSEAVKVALDRVSRDVEVATARASAAETLARTLRTQADEDAALASASASEVRKLQSELAKAKRLQGSMSLLDLGTNKRDESEGGGGADDSSQQDHTVVVDSSPLDTFRPKKTDSPLSSSPSGAKEQVTKTHPSQPSEQEGFVTADASQRRVIVGLQTELADATLKLGDAAEKVLPRTHMLPGIMTNRFHFFTAVFFFTSFERRKRVLSNSKHILHESANSEQASRQSKTQVRALVFVISTCGVSESPSLRLI
jgi:hypothetical protein